MKDRVLKDRVVDDQVVTVLELSPAELLDPRGFSNGDLLDGYAPVTSFSANDAQPVDRRCTVSVYGDSRHLLRCLVTTHLLPLFPWAASQVVHQGRGRSPLYLALVDDEGCPLRAREEELRSSPSVFVEESEVRALAGRVYPLRTGSEVALYESLGLPFHAHEAALELVRPFCGLGDDVLCLAGEVYAVSYAGLDRCCLPEDREFLDVLAERLSSAVAAARSLLA